MKVAALVALIGTASLALAEEPKLDRLLVSGKGWSFGVKEPDGWASDTEAKAQAHQANVFFFPAEGPGDSAAPSIRVRIADKTDEEVEKDLEADMAGYKKAKRKVEFLEFDTRHPEYRTACKIFYQRRKFSEYVCYVTPGEQFHYIFSVALTPKAAEATAEEVEAFRDVLTTLVAIPSR